MSIDSISRRFKWMVVAVSLVSLALSAFAQTPPPRVRQFAVGSLNQLSDLPVGPFRLHVQKLPPLAQQRALAWLRSFHFTEQDLPSLRADSAGGILYVCPAEAAESAPSSFPETAGAALPVDPLPWNLVLHSRPGAPNVIYLNFCGEDVSNTQWNSELGRSVIPAVPFSTDTDLTTFIDAEQLAIRRIWQRVAEDYAPFDVDVTTERPAVLTSRTALALITRSTDANGDLNPQASGAGGIAYVNVFGTTGYSRYRPAWIYHNNVGNQESYIAEAVAHEVAHNLGLSHDGKTDGSDYYGGHGTGDVSWAPVMGTGYNRNVSQWSKGDYYLANNTQDDLGTIAGKLSYRSDDHGNTAGTASRLFQSNSIVIAVTNPETDPANINPSNKGVLERNTDVDVFSFVTGTGAIDLSVKPWSTPAGLTRGGNLDLLVELYSETGALLATSNPALLTTAQIKTNLPEGRYYLHIRNTGYGDPFNSNPSGYTSYGSLGQYFVSGYVAPSTGFIVPPVAEIQTTDITQAGTGNKQFTVQYSDDFGIRVSTLNALDIRVTGPNGYNRLAQFTGVDTNEDGTPRLATYAATPPNGSAWLPADNGTYALSVETNQVGDVEGAWVAPGRIGEFRVSVPATIYSANMNFNPGWTLEPQWAYGLPGYTTTSGPRTGFTGTHIIGYNLTGDYENRLTMRYATTPPINCSGAASVTLRFRRWLRLKNSDTAVIEVSTDGTSWTRVWSASAAVTDWTWQDVQYQLPASVTGSRSVRLRWGIASNPAQTDIGWNIDDVELLAGGQLDTSPPLAALSIADVKMPGSPSHSCTVTYTDATAVRLSSLGSSDLLVTGPNGYSNLVEFVGVDLPSDGSPCTATYSIPAPGGTWDPSDNGTYQVTLQASEVDDSLGNAVSQLVLGTFAAAIPLAQTNTYYSLSVTVNQPDWGAVTPATGSYLAGSDLELLASAAPYFRFAAWSGDLSGSDNPIRLLLARDASVSASFAELLTTNYPTPHWWLAAQGYTNDFETAVTAIGRNGMPLWQCYIAGLDPSDPESRLQLSAAPAPDGTACVLSWNPVADRFYSLWSSANPTSGYVLVPGASRVPGTVSNYTHSVEAPGAATFYRLQVSR